MKLIDRYESLRRLYFGDINSISSVDGMATFTLGTLQGAINQILSQRKPVNVRTLDYLSDYDGGDHPDHLTTARITASLASGTANFAGYMGYPVQNLPATLSTSSAAYQNKINAFFAYTPYDYASTKLCWSVHKLTGVDGLPGSAYMQWAGLRRLASKTVRGYSRSRDQVEQWLCPESRCSAARHQYRFAGCRKCQQPGLLSTSRFKGY